MSLLEAADLNVIRNPTKSIQAFTEAYTLSIASLPFHYAISSSSPTNSIQLLDKSNLRAIRAIDGAHDEAITSMKTVYNLVGSKGDTLMSTGKDAFVKTWDERTGQAALTLSSPRRHAVTCCDVSPDGLTIAVGTELRDDDAPIYYFDPRNPSAPLRTHTDTHSDDITSLSFLANSTHAQTTTQNVLLSTSTDGLVCTSNADEEDEDEAGIYVGNTNCSLSQAGWIEGSGKAKVWTASDTEEFGVWTGDLDLLHTLDIRDPSAHTERRTWVTDYLITCHSTSTLSSTGSSLGVFVGSNEGDIALITNADLSNPSSPWSLRDLWIEGHEGVVRSLLWDEANNILLTGGEDGKLNAWPFPPPDEPGYCSRPSAGDVKMEDVSEYEMVVDDGNPASLNYTSGNDRKKRGFESLARGDRVERQDGKRTRR